MQNRLTMTNEQAEEMVNDILERTREVLMVKAKEYVRNDDRMHNFNVGAEKKGVIRERIIESFRLKHEISRDDIIEDMEKGILPSEAYVDEKYGDIINYFILEEMSIKSKIRKNGGN